MAGGRLQICTGESTRSQSLVASLPALAKAAPQSGRAWAVAGAAEARIGVEIDTGPPAANQGARTVQIATTSARGRACSRTTATSSTRVPRTVGPAIRRAAHRQPGEQQPAAEKHPAPVTHAHGPPSTETNTFVMVESSRTPQAANLAR